MTYNYVWWIQALCEFQPYISVHVIHFYSLLKIFRYMWMERTWMLRLGCVVQVIMVGTCLTWTFTRPSVYPTGEGGLGWDPLECKWALIGTGKVLEKQCTCSFYFNANYNDVVVHPGANSLLCTSCNYVHASLLSACFGQCTLAL